MAYNEDFANLIRELLADEEGVTEQKMFGGLAFLIGGHMAIAASGEGGLLLRTDPNQSDDLISSSGAEPMVMRGKEMRGWLRVAAPDVRTKRQLEAFVATGVAYARSLPPKTRKGRAPSS